MFLYPILIQSCAVLSPFSIKILFYFYSQMAEQQPSTFLGSKEAKLSVLSSSNRAWRYFYLMPQFQKPYWQQWRHNTSLGKEKQMSHSAPLKLPTIRSLGLLPFPLWGVHKQSTCLQFAENLNTVKMTEKKGSLVATPLAIETPFGWRLCCFPACAVYDTRLGDWLRSFHSALAACSDTSLAFWSTAIFPLRFPI